jgi:hypothetical protein
MLPSLNVRVTSTIASDRMKSHCSTDSGITEIANLKVILTGHDGGRADSIIYAKVIGAATADSNCYEMRFTYVPGEISTYFDDTLKTGHRSL